MLHRRAAADVPDRVRSPPGSRGRSTSERGRGGTCRRSTGRARRTVLGRSVGVGHAHDLGEAGPVGVAVEACLNGELPEPGHDPFADLAAEERQHAVAVVVLGGGAPSRGAAQAGDPDRRVGLLDRAGPEVHHRKAFAQAVKEERLGRLPGPHHLRDFGGCTPTANAVVDLWHCDATATTRDSSRRRPVRAVFESSSTGASGGGPGGRPPGGGGPGGGGNSPAAAKRYLRGSQVTGADGSPRS